MKSPALFANSLRIAIAATLLSAQVIPAADLHTTPSGADLLIQKARSLEARDRQDLAVQVWQQVLVTNPSQPDALAALARWAKRNGRNDDANAYLAKLRRLSPDSSALTEFDSLDSARQGSSRLEEATRLAANQHYEEAMRIYREVFGSNPPVGGWSVAYYQTLANTSGGFEPAVAALKKLAESYPDVPDYKVAAGTLMTYRPTTREAGIKLLSSIEGSTSAASKARLAWRQALLWEKSNPGYSGALHSYLTRYNDPELQALAAAMPAPAKVEPLSAGSKEEQLGYAALKKNDASEAERLFDSSLAKDESNWRAHAGLGFARMKAGEFDGAVQQLEAAHKAAPGDATVRSSLETAKFWRIMQSAAKSADQEDWAAAVTSYRAALALRPKSDEAIRGLGGSLLASGEPDKAIPYLSQAVHARSSDESSWCALAQAKLQTEGGRAALAVMQSTPPSAAASLKANVEWKALESLAYADAGDDSQALKIYRDLTGSEPGELKADEQVQLASLALHFHQPAQAIPYAQKAVEAAPNHTGGWEVLISALVAVGRYGEADRTFVRMPAKAQESAIAHPSFQETLASLKENSGDPEGARKLLEQLVDSPELSLKEHDRTEARIHLAQVLVKLGQTEEALTMIGAITDAHAEDIAAWRAQLLILQTLHRPSEIVAVTARMPQAVAVRLGSEGDMVNLLANAHAASGNPELGVRLLETYISRTETSDSTGALSQRIQLGWLLLNSPRTSGRLYSLLDQLNARTDLNADQRKEVSQLWATWILRTADAAHKAGNGQRALALLEKGTGMFPANPDLQRALAGNLLAQGDTKRAFNVYANWGLSGAQPDDYAGAASAALAEHNTQYADTWLDRGLAQWPNNPKLLTLAGERARSHGDLKKAEMFWKEALAQKQNTPADPSSADGSVQQSSLRALLVGSDPLGVPSRPVSYSRSDRQSASSPSEGDTAQVHLSSFQPGNSPDGDVDGASAFMGDPVTPQSANGSSLLAKFVAPTPSDTDSLQDKIAAVDSRNSPYLSSSMSVWGRDGQSGFSRLVIQQAQFEASTTLSNEMRASVLLEPTYLSGGTADGSGIALFGTQSAPAGFGPQNASGVAAEAQLSSDSVGLRVGISPQGFLTHNWIGGFRLQPKHGPITFLLERDSVKDTMLSYAGSRDPVSGQIWGGVMANTASVQGRWGDDKSGVYVNGGYQTLDGRSVARNTAENGNVGAWWKVASLSTGNLTVGMNFSAMHYAENLRYFTLGQGGYFSPQQYFLFSVPLRWTGSYGHRVQYTIGGSVGSQHFTEDSSPYYPTDAALQASSKLFYQPFASTGANFSFDGRLSYQMTPHWFLGAFATANNARDYTAASAGLFVKYTFEERPMNLDNNVPSIPDWRGQQPFSMF
ncbi:MAG: cellulose synthase subunit BcsC-related outer membrane protein [Acidobacteriota bacterium]|nr:cellulose synthase subunit BcsC-related outer membrane protein [Acidobacteriota bacterium]